MVSTSNLSANPIDTDALPWISLGSGESFKPLRFMPNGRALLLRLDPGTVVPRHRHLGEVHGINLAGHRRLLDTNEIVGPGGYVYEPAGNVDSWMAIGEEPVIVHIVSFGAMEYLGDDGEVLRRDTPSSLYEIYLRYCRSNAAAVYARLALGASFLSAVASRFGLWEGRFRWTRFDEFVVYTSQVNSFLPGWMGLPLAWAATVAETVLAVALFAGIRLRIASFAAAGLLALFAAAMTISFGLKSPLDYSVFSASAAALLLAHSRSEAKDPASDHLI